MNIEVIEAPKYLDDFYGQKDVYFEFLLDDENVRAYATISRTLVNKPSNGYYQTPGDPGDSIEEIIFIEGPEELESIILELLNEAGFKI